MKKVISYQECVPTHMLFYLFSCVLKSCVLSLFLITSNL
jgi:hypothetical protein